MKRKCLEQPSIDGRFGWKYQSAIEDETGVTSTFIDPKAQTHTIRSKYLIGCDGGGSKVRKTAGIRMVGGYLYVWLSIRP
jgi:2-polyprenyl-6-methoxyphenol hydroxylase-like FAD-dependent oxidoreductase